MIFNKVPENCTEEPLYDMILGGYIKPEDFSDDPHTIKTIKEAYQVIQMLYEYLNDNDCVM